MYADRLRDYLTKRTSFEERDSRLGLGCCTNDRRDAIEDTNGDPDVAIVAGNQSCVVRMIGKAAKVNVGGVRGYIIPTSRDRSKFAKREMAFIRGWCGKRNIVFFSNGRICRLNLNGRDNVGCFV